MYVTISHGTAITNTTITRFTRVLEKTLYNTGPFAVLPN